jgi:hypothetical protein
MADEVAQRVLLEDPVTITADRIREWTAAMRQETAVRPPRPGMVKTPDDIVRELDVVDHNLNRGLFVLRRADELRARKQDELAKASILARKAALGTIPDKAAYVEEHTAEETEAAQDAELAYRYARSTTDWMDKRKSSLQTQAKLVIATMQEAALRREP